MRQPLLGKYNSIKSPKGDILRCGEIGITKVSDTFILGSNPNTSTKVML